MKGNQMLSSTWIYTHVFKLSEVEMEEEREGIVADEKFKYRLAQIELEGNDPAKSGQDVRDGEIVDPYTPSEEGENGGGNNNFGGFKGEDDMEEVDFEDDKFKQGGRPRGNQTKYATDKHVLGRDPIGRNAMSLTEIKNIIRGIDNKKLGPVKMMDEDNIIDQS